MRSETKYTLKCNKIVFCYLLYAIAICLNDYLVFLFKWDYMISFIMSGILIVLAAVIYLKQNTVIGWEKIAVNKYDRIFALMIVAQCTVRAIMPDSCYDTLNYHLYYQKFFDRDFINYDFFPMRSFNAQTFGAIGDRLFYGFRYFLGYRMGTLLNTLVVVLIYFQIKQLFCMVWTEFGHECQTRWSEAFISIGTFVCMMTETTYANLSNYMVDYLALPFVLEIFRIVLCKGEDEKETSVAHTAGYLCIMSGFAVGIKITNCLLIFPLAVFFLFKQRKRMNIKCIFCSFLVFLYPLLLYLFISYKITGNPVFPYLNRFFQSPYFSATRSPNDFSAFNSRFGPTEMGEYLLWPFYMLKFPERTSDIATCSGRLLILFVTFIIAVPCEFKKFTCKIKHIFLYWVYCYVLFLSVLHGYMRYIPILEILGSVLAFVILAEWIYHRGAVRRRAGTVIALLILCQISLATDNYILKNCEWSWRSIKDVSRMMLNLPYVLRDQDAGVGINHEILDDIQCFVVPDPSGSLAVELKDDVPIIGINSYFATTNEYTAQLLDQKLQDISELNIYSVTNKDGWMDNFEIFNSRGLALEEIITIQPDFWDKIYCLPLMKLKPVDDAISVNYENFSSSEEKLTIDIADDIDYIDIFIGDIVPERKRTDNEYRLSVVGRNLSTGEEQILLQNAVITQTGRYLKESVDLSDYDIDQIEIRKLLDDEEDIKETFQVVLQKYSE